MNPQRRFTVRDALQSGGTTEERLRRCFVAAKGFLDVTRPAGLLAGLFADEGRRATVLRATNPSMHVGFLLPPDGLDAAALDRMADQVGFTGRHVTCPSAIITRELGAWTGRPALPTTIFTAHAPATDERAVYLEAFIPTEAPDGEGRWIAEELGTHVGLTLAAARDDRGLHEAFLAEGFRLPAFMHGRPLTNAATGATAVFYDRCSAEERVRVELLAWQGGHG
jgi:hypothetical protein